MKKLILKLNHILFSWYYKRVDEHFRDKTIIKSVKNLIDNYQHQKWCISRHDKELKEFCQMAEKERKMRLNLQMQMVGTDEQIEQLNKMFGLNNPKKSDN